MQYSWGKSLNLIFLNVLKHRRKVIFVATISSVLIIAGSAFLRLNTSIIVGFQKHEPELEKVAYFDNNFDGYKPFELGVNIAKGRSLMNTEVLQEIEKIENYLSREYQVSHIESPLNLIREINAGLNGGSGNYLKIPLDKDLNKVGRLYYSPKLQAVRRLFQTKNQSTIRLIGRSKDIGSFEARKLNESLNEYINQEINPQIINAKLTGTSYLIDKTDNYIVTSLLKGIGLATLTVSFLLLIFFREWRLVFVSLIPNLIPVLMLFGLMGLFQIDLNISTAIIFTVAFGIAVDDSIHLIVRYYMEKKKSKNSIWAMKKTFLGTGKSIIVTSLIILSGFSLFMTSGLSSPFYLGLFIAITALVALIFDLAVLPILMLKISKKD